MSCRSVLGHDLLSQTCLSPTGPRRLEISSAAATGLILLALCSAPSFRRSGQRRDRVGGLALAGWLVVQLELRTELGHLPSPSSPLILSCMLCCWPGADLHR